MSKAAAKLKARVDRAVGAANGVTREHVLAIQNKALEDRLAIALMRIHWTAKFAGEYESSGDIPMCLEADEEWILDDPEWCAGQRRHPYYKVCRERIRKWLDDGIKKSNPEN